MAGRAKGFNFQSNTSIALSTTGKQLKNQNSSPVKLNQGGINLGFAVTDQDRYMVFHNLSRMGFSTKEAVGLKAVHGKNFDEIYTSNTRQLQELSTENQELYIEN